MDFDWAAWHKKFDDFGISTKVNGDQHSKFPGSFPETEDKVEQQAEDPQSQSQPESSSSQANGRQYTAHRGWRQEMHDEANDPVWNDHLDKLQASGKLRERTNAYADSHDMQEESVSELEAEPELPKFSFEELQEMLTDAECLRKDGNELYKSGKEIDFEAAIETYQRALAALPETSIERARKESLEKKRSEALKADTKVENEASENKPGVPPMPESGIVELTDEQAAELEKEEVRKREEALQAQRRSEEDAHAKENDHIHQVEEKIEEIKGFLYGNISAAYVALNKDSEAVEAASKSLSISPENDKVRLRRAKVNEKIGKFTSLSEALEDYKYLKSSLPPTDPRLRQVRHALSTLPTRIQEVGKEEMDKMMSQMKEWGDSVLGWFGMKCDDFKTETKADGSTSININKSS